jgi:hypothetical protein
VTIFLPRGLLGLIRKGPPPAAPAADTPSRRLDDGRSSATRTVARAGELQRQARAHVGPATGIAQPAE